MIGWFRRRKQFPLQRIGFHSATELMDGVNELVDTLKTLMNRGITQVGDFIDAAQFLHHLGSNGGGGHFAAAGFKFVHDFIDGVFQGNETDGPFLARFGQAVDELSPIEGFMRSIAFHDPEIRTLHLLVSSKAIGAAKTFSAATNTGAIARLARINDLIVIRPALGATHGVKD
jgi:hypothetical protein